ncbi:MAG: hypothetical protein EBU88_08435 [Acidobacteria bacterium]|nr:hypothetical protein [Acidobacteriota bacterium]
MIVFSDHFERTAQTQQSKSVSILDLFGSVFKRLKSSQLIWPDAVDWRFVQRSGMIGLLIGGPWYSWRYQ